MEERGKTIAVLGGGFKHIFPRENKELYRQIIKNGGLIVSEYSPEVKTKSENFLERNRIVSGLSNGVLIIESAYRSGTSVTAKLAKEQGRKVFALPHEIGDIHGVGNNRLIKEGTATMVCTTEEIIETIPKLSYKEMQKNRINDLKIKQNISIHNKKSKMDNSQKRERKICKNQQYNSIYKLITEKPCTLNEIYKKSNEHISTVNNILLMLEIEGYIEKVAGGYKCITNI